MPGQINLYSPLFLKKEKLFSVRTMGWGLAIVAGALAAFYAYAVFESLAIEREAAASAERLAAERARIAQALRQLPAEAARKALESEAARLESEREGRQKLLEKLQSGALGNAEGVSQYFAALARRTVPGVWLTGVTVGEGANELSLRGRMLKAELAPVYLRALGAEEAFRGRQLVEMKLEARSSPEGEEKAKGPAQYLEFVLSAPRRAAEPEAREPGGAR